MTRSNGNSGNDPGKAGATAPAFIALRRLDPPSYAICIHPHRSYGWRGLSVVLALAGIGLAFPLIGLAGTSVAWGILPFLVLTLITLYVALKRNYEDAALHEDIRLWPDMISVIRYETDGRVLEWHANPYWTTAHLHHNAKIEKYVTLKGNGREIELGAFLSPEERQQIYDELTAALLKVRSSSE